MGAWAEGRGEGEGRGSVNSCGEAKPVSETTKTLISSVSWSSAVYFTCHDHLLVIIYRTLKMQMMN